MVIESENQEMMTLPAEVLVCDWLSADLTAEAADVPLVLQSQLRLPRPNLLSTACTDYTHTHTHTHTLEKLYGISKCNPQCCIDIRTANRQPDQTIKHQSTAEGGKGGNAHGPLWIIKCTDHLRALLALMIQPLCG